MKICVECEHNSRSMWCKRPRASGLDPVTGKNPVVFASVERRTPLALLSSEPTCGPDGIFFVPKKSSNNGIRWYQFWKR
jgi:hypothetical protein